MKEKHKRPALLIVLCTLTFIWSGLWTLISFAGIFFASFMSSFINEFTPEAENLPFDSFILICILLLLLFGLSLWGAILMFHRRKGGYVMYTISNGIMLTIQAVTLLIHFSIPSSIYLLVSIAFIILYGLTLKHIR